MTLIFRFVNFLGLVVYLLVLQSCQPIVSEGMLKEQGSYPDQIIILDAIQLSAEAGSTHAPFTIRLVDRLNNPVPQANISFLTTTGSAYGSSIMTNLNGEVDVTWNFGHQLGLQQLKIFAELNGHLINKIVTVFLTQSIPSAAQSTITGSGPVPADGRSQSTITITIRNSSGIGIPDFYPTFTATDTSGKNIYGLCSPTNAGGVSLCTLRSKAAEVKTLQLETPVVKTGGTVSFTSVTPIISLEFTTVPVAGTTDDELTTQPVVTGYIAPGEVDSSNDTTVINITSYDGVDCTGSEIADSLDGDTAILMNNGVATFTNVKPLKTSIKSIMASSESLSTCENVTVLPGAPANIAIQSGNDQEAEVTSTLDPFIALITDTNNNPVPGATVNWSIESGTGTLSTASSLSGITGLASSTLTFDTTAEIFSVKATLVANAESILFSAEALAAQPNTLTINGGDGQTATVGSPLPVQLSVKILDQYSNPVPDIDINWVNLSGAGSLAAAQTSTDESGVATVSYTLGTIAGLNEISATVDGYALLTDTFNATGVSGAASLITIESGDGQSANYSTAITNPMEIKVTDQYLNPVENATIIWTTSVGTLTTPALTTNASGLATSGLTFNNVAGTLRSVTATLDTATVDPSVTFNHTANVPAPTNLAGVDGAGDVDLTWDAVTDANSYKIYTSATSGGPYTLADTSLTNSYNDLSITGITYIVVKAVQGTIESADSNEISTPNLTSWLTQIGVTNGGSTTLNLSSAGDDFCKKSVKSGGFLYCAGSTTGSLKEPNGGGKDGVIVKFDPQGSVVWIHQLGAITKHPSGTNSGNEECTSLAVSNDGLSIYCAGNTSGSMSETNGGGKDAFIAKIFHDGTLTWLVQLGQTNGAGFSKGDSSGNDVCESLTLDSFNNAYCAGSTTSTVSGDQDAFVAKIDSATGALSWLTQINSATNPSGLVHTLDESCLALASNGTEVYCAGATKGNLGITPRVGSDNDVFYAAFDTTTGAINWITQTYSASGDDYCLSLFYESTLIPNQLFCAGKTTGSFAEANAGAVAGSTDAFVMSLNPVSGLSNWGIQLGDTTGALDPSSHTGNDSFLSITSDGVKIYAGGETDGFMSEPNAGEMDAFISVFTVGGNYLSTKHFGATSLPVFSGDGAGTEACSGIEILNDAGDDKLYCIGSTTSNFAETTGGLSDIFYVILNLTTPSTSLNQIGSTYGLSSPINKAALNDVCKAITQDNSGNVYCAGHTYGNLGETNAGGADAFIMKLNKNGQVQWISQLGVETLTNVGDGSGDDFCTGIALDSDGNIYCGGYTTGNLKDSNGGGSDIFLAKFDSLGELDWINHYGVINLLAPGGDNSGEDKCHALAAHSDAANDYIYCVGETDSSIESNAGGSDAFVVKFDTDGVPLWSYQIGAASNVTFTDKSQDDVFYSVSVDNISGNIYAGGTTKGSLFAVQQGVGDAIVVKFDNSGVLESGYQWGGAGQDQCLSTTLKADQNEVYCAGATQSTLSEALAGTEDGFVSSFSTGFPISLLWISQLGLGSQNPPGSNDGADKFNSIALDSNGNIFCGGETDGFPGETNGGGKDAFVAKFDTSGSLQDIYQLGNTTLASGSGPHDKDEICSSMKITSTGEIICGGTTMGSLTDSNGFGNNDVTNDIMIFKLNSTGSF